MTIGKRSPASNPRKASPPLNATPTGLRGPVPADRLGAAAWLVRAAVGLVVMAVVVAAGDGLWRATAPPENGIRLYRALGLNEVALTPAGRRERAPGFNPTSIDWRFLPTLPQKDPGLIRLLGTEPLLRPAGPPP